MRLPRAYPMRQAFGGLGGLGMKTIDLKGTFEGGLLWNDIEHAQNLGGLSLWRLTLEEGAVRLEVDDGFFSAFGYPASDFTTSFNAFVTKALHPEDQDLLSEAVGECFNRGQSGFRMEYRMRHGTTGQWRWVRSLGESRELEDGTGLVIIGCTVDVHEYFTALEELKKVQDALHNERERMAAIIDAADMAVWDWNLETDEITYGASWSPGESLEDDSEPIGSVWEQFVTPQDRARSREVARRHAQGELPRYEVEYRMRRPNGKDLWIQDRGRVVERDDNGRALRLMGVLIDVTSQKMTEKALREQKEQMEMIIDAAKVGTWDWNVTGNYLSFNITYTDMLGYSPGELDGSVERWRSFVHPEDLEQIARHFTEVFVGPGMTYENTLRMRHKDGHYVPTHDIGRVVAVTDDGQAARIVGIQVLQGIALDPRMLTHPSSW
ncbi:hypothetical protein C4J81_17320 [Deltaproteobacteria bacterium Smac51]|nr:hypothetical protein C4J81_17320 [Deltaproteobacteria bacterium Smac51]